MNNSAELQNATNPMEPLEPGRPDVMPNPPGTEQTPAREGEVPLPRDDDAPVDEERQDVDANNSISEEHPPTH
jgi:hypothetical protein